MKNISIILIALLLFGLCLMEKELKKRAVRHQLSENGKKEKEVNLSHESHRVISYLSSNRLTSSLTHPRHP